jgi:hypothetical protein
MNSSKCFRQGALMTALMLAFVPVFGQPPDTAPAPATAAANPAAKTFSQQDLDQLLAPIALYPDALLAQVLMASTYPLEVVEAARWSKANPKVTGKALEDAMAKQAWDPAVKSMTSVPQVLKQMDEKLEWTQKLGDAFLAQQADVMDTIQTLRGKASAQGNLKTTEQQVVRTETQGSQTIYVVESPTPETFYVPTYNPSTIYGPWWYPAPPYYMYPPTYAYAPGVAFATGVFVGAAIWGACRWGGGWGNGSVNVNVNRYNSFNRTSISNSNFNHNSAHRRGVAYKDQGVANQYNRGGDRQAAASREQFRGRTEGAGDRGGDRGGGRGGDRGGDRGGAGGRGDGGFGGGDRGGAGGDRGGAGGDRGGAGGGSSFGGGDRGGAGGRGDGGFGGVGNGASTREASARGNASRGGGGHDFSGGGGGRSAGASGGGSRSFSGGGGGGGSRGGGGGGRGGGGRR